MHRARFSALREVHPNCTSMARGARRTPRGPGRERGLLSVFSWIHWDLNIITYPDHVPLPFFPSLHPSHFLKFIIHNSQSSTLASVG